MKQKKYEEAIKDCDLSIQQDENYFKVMLFIQSYLRRGKIREEMEDFEGAIFDYKKVHELDSSILVLSKVKIWEMPSDSAKSAPNKPKKKTIIRF